MKVKRLKINSFRGIGDLTLEFHETEPTVLVGINGTGKSSILDCIALLLSHFVAELQDPIGTGHFINEQDITEERKIPRHFFSQEDIANGAHQTKNEITISLRERQISWFLSLSNTKGRPRGGNIRELEGICLRIKNQLQNNLNVNLPVVVYYPVNRQFCDKVTQEATKYYWSNQLAIYDHALTGVSINFGSFFEWFKDLEDLENEWRRDNPEHRDRLLEAIRQAISSLLPGFANLRVRRAPLRMTVTKQGRELVVNQLSEGEKGLLSLAADLAKRLAIANPGLANPLEGSGVVLIDEIELHLHPKWQHEIVPALTRTFPNCQFIVATHSPQVIANVNPQQVYLLQAIPDSDMGDTPMIIAKHPEPSMTQDSNSLIEELMEVSVTL